MAPRLKVGPRRRTRASRVSFDVLLQHGRHCPYCARVMRVLIRRLKAGQRMPADFPTRDHVIPKSRMPAQGTLFVCHACNRDKRDMTLTEWLVVLKRSGDRRAEVVAKLMKDEAWRKSLFHEDRVPPEATSLPK